MGQTSAQTPSIFAAGLDVGHSAVKISTSFFSSIIKTAVCREIQISDESEARRARDETVDVPGHGRYFFGETALVQGVNAGSLGLSDSWIETPEYAALVLAGLRKITRASNGAAPSIIVMGLPAALYARQKRPLLDLSARILPGTRIVVAPQSYAPYVGLKLNFNGIPDRRYAEMNSFAVIEVGYYTTDFAMIQDDRPVERANTSCSGVRVAVEALQRILSNKGMQADMSECETSIVSRSIKHFGRMQDIGHSVDAAIAPLVSEVNDAANRLFEAHARKLDGIILAGGGAHLVERGLRDRWPNLILPEDPRFAVAEGLRRMGEAKLMMERA